jgi:hypothetical protein
VKATSGARQTSTILKGISNTYNLLCPSGTR